MSRFFEKLLQRRNPEATPKSFLHWMALGGGAMLWVQLTSARNLQKGVWHVLLMTVYGAVLGGVLNWKVTPWTCSKKELGQDSVAMNIFSTTMAVFGVVLLVLGLALKVRELF